MRLHVIEQTTERSTFAHGRPKMRAFEKAPVRIVSAQALCPFLADQPPRTMNVGESTVLEKVCRRTAALATLRSLTRKAIGGSRC